jgi:hypothetical protein
MFEVSRAMGAPMKIRAMLDIKAVFRGVFIYVSYSSPGG